MERALTVGFLAVVVLLLPLYTVLAIRAERRWSALGYAAVALAAAVVIALRLVGAPRP
jgi:hypothetical protein